jgi:hypothetical protein
MIRKDAKFKWDKEHEEEFRFLKNKLIQAPIMAFPDFKFPFILTTDACKEGFGAILSQNIGRKEHVIAYASKSTTKEEQKMGTASELEATR